MNLEKYIDKALVLYKDAYSKLDVWNMERQAAKNKFKEEAKRLNSQAARDESEKIAKEYNEKRDAIVKELNEGVAAVEAEYLQEVKAFYAPNGAAISAEDQALLASGILTTGEISEMILKHADNPTMERIIKQYVNQNQIEDLPTEASKALALATYGGENEQRIFNKFKQLVYTPVNMALQGMAGTEAFMNTAIKADEYANGIKIDLLKTKLVLSDGDKERIRQSDIDRIAAQKMDYNSGNVDF